MALCARHTLIILLLHLIFSLFLPVQVPAGTHKVSFTFQPLAGAIAELEARFAPKEPEDTLPLPPPVDRNEPQVVTSTGEEPFLAGLSPSVRDSLGLGPVQRGPASRNGTASAQIFGESEAH